MTGLANGVINISDWQRGMEKERMCLNGYSPRCYISTETLKDENELGTWARRNLCIHKILWFTYNYNPKDKDLVIFLPMNLGEFCCKIISIIYSHCRMVVKMVKDLLFPKTHLSQG